MSPVTQPRPPDNVQFANVCHLLQVLVVLVSTGLEAEQVLPAVTRLTTHLLIFLTGHQPGHLETLAPGHQPHVRPLLLASHRGHQERRGRLQSDPDQSEASVSNIDQSEASVTCPW